MTVRSPLRPGLLAALPLLLAAACGGGSSSSSSSGPALSGDGLFTASNVWSEAVDAAPLTSSSAAMIARLGAQGFGLGRLQIDFSLVVLERGSSAVTAPLQKAPGYYAPDCDDLASLPLPPGGAVEGEAGYACTGGGDCHLLVVDRAAGRLYEAWAASQPTAGAAVTASCAVAWELSRSYPASLRGEKCTSADAAGLPIAPLTFSADEIAAGRISHALRFVLPNDRIRAGVYVHPATHAGAPSGPADAVPYGSRLRLRAGFDLATLPTEGARVVARTLQKYGMILADGGNVAFTARDDRFTVHKWADVGIDSHSLQAIQPADFEVVDTGGTIVNDFACTRTPLTGP